MSIENNPNSNNHNNNINNNNTNNGNPTPPINTKPELPNEKQTLVNPTQNNINSANPQEENVVEGEIHTIPNDNNPTINTHTSITESSDPNFIQKKQNAYLRDKIAKMNINTKIVTGVNKSIDKEMKNIEDNIFNDQILITEVKKNINSFVKKSSSLSSDELEFKNKNNVPKSQIKQIKDLKTDRDILLNKLQKIKTNEDLLLYMDKNSEKLKNLEKQKKSIEMRISQINEKIANIFKKQKTEEANINRKERIKYFLANFENDKEKIENRAKKYLEETKAREKRIATDLEQISKKAKQEMEEKTKEAELKKANLRKKFKEQEKAVENKRREQNCNTYNKYKPFLKNKNKNTDYLFMAKDKKYLEEEAKLIKTENLKRKQLMKCLDFTGLNEFEKNYIDNKEKKLTQLGESKKVLINEWKERKQSLQPLMKNQKSFMKTETENNNTEEEEENNKKKQIEMLNQKKIDYSLQIKENKVPIIDEKLKEQRINKIKELENPKECILNEHKIKINALSLSKINKSQELKNMKIRVIIKNSSTQRELPIPKDYLAEMRNKRTGSDIKVRENQEKWDKEINNDKGNLIDNINNVRQKAKALQEEANSKEKVLRLKGGIQNNIELGNKISKLIIDSIEAKLSILNKISE